MIFLSRIKNLLLLSLREKDGTLAFAVLDDRRYYEYGDFETITPYAAPELPDGNLLEIKPNG